MPQKTVLFCGGGSLGHIAPSVAVADALKAADSSVLPVFVCSNRAEEHTFIQKSGYRFLPLSAPRFPRGLSAGIFTFPFAFIASLVKAFRILTEENPAAVFSKGGAVCVPLCLAAACKKIPVVLHASDSVLSVGDSIVARVATRVCTGFAMIGIPESLKPKFVQTGNPVRSFITTGSRDAGCRLTGFSGKKPVLLIIGGSQGAMAINDAINNQFDALINAADIIHLTGSGKTINRTHARYFARPTVFEELPHLYALADIVISRAGAGALSELALLSKPSIIIPLEGVAHNHQRKNADALAGANAIDLLPQESIKDLTSHVTALLADSEKRIQFGKALHAAFPPDAGKTIAHIVLDVLAAKKIES